MTSSQHSYFSGEVLDTVVGRALVHENPRADGGRGVAGCGGYGGTPESVVIRDTSPTRSSIRTPRTGQRVRDTRRKAVDVQRRRRQRVLILQALATENL